MRQDKNQPETQTSKNIAEHETEACDNNPSGPIGTKSTPPTKSAGNSSGSANAKNAPSKKGDRGATERAIWEGVTYLSFFMMAIVVVLAAQILFGWVCAVVALLLFLVVLFVNLLYVKFRGKEIPSSNRSQEGLRSSAIKWIAEHTREIVEVLILLIVVILIVSISVADSLALPIFLVDLFFMVFASCGVLCCWKVDGAKGARERAMGMVTVVATVAGIILAVAALLR